MVDAAGERMPARPGPADEVVPAARAEHERDCGAVHDGRRASLRPVRGRARTRPRAARRRRRPMGGSVRGSEAGSRRAVRRSAARADIKGKEGRASGAPWKSTLASGPTRRSYETMVTFWACGPLSPCSTSNSTCRALGQGLEALTADRRVVDEDVLAAVARGDEAVALRVVEPLDSSCWIALHLLLPTSRTGRRGALCASGTAHERRPG